MPLRYASIDRPATNANSDKDLPLREDTRLLGRLAGRRAARADRRATDSRGSRRSARPRSASAAPARRRGRRPRRARARCSTTADRDRRSTSCARSATSRISRTSPRTCTRTARRRAHALAGSPPQRGSLADALDRVAAAAASAGSAGRDWFARRAGVPGADGASDRGAAQEHPRLRARDRAAPAVARPRRADAGRGARVRDAACTGRCWRCGRPR